MSGSRGVARERRERVARTAFVLALGLGAGLGSLSGAADELPPDAQLERLRERIEDLDRRLELDRRAHEDLVGELRETELQIARSAAALARTEAAMTERQRELHALAHERAQLEDSTRGQRRRLARQIRLGYALARQDRVILILNQHSPSTLARALTYHDYFQRDLARSIDELAARLGELDSLRRRIEAATADLEALRARQRLVGRRLSRERAERARTVSRLAEGIADDAQRLEHLRADERRLEALVRELEAERRETGIPDDDRPAFARLKGRLPWPAEGQVRRTGREAGWQGVIIGAPNGAPVRAVSHGRIAFADWLRGFGLLIIVDHGDGYMSLYGRNEVLLKEVGEWVDAAEPIARVGASGGAEEPGLYFEIRERGSPRNPRVWCTVSHDVSATLVSPCEPPVCFASLLPAGPGEVHEIRDS